MLGLLALVVTVLVVLAVPLLLLKLAFQLVFTLITLPFKLVGMVLGLVFGVVGFVFKLLFSAAGLVFGLLAAVLLLLVVPLLPFVLVGLAVWLVVRESRRPRRTVIAA